ncbi:MAG TPA: protein kinase [Steroidobacteraceae bacterium]|jgi:serine/threonine-protein kinase|nr:protein kinase [Steroidobacteraceae bacterium]
MTTKDEWQKLSRLFDQALEMDDLQRSQWLAQLELNDPEAAAQVRAFLATRDRVGAIGFLEQPLVTTGTEASWIGRQVGPYTISALIGQGGMGNVWLALRSDGRFEGRFAIKFLRAVLSLGQGTGRFLQEGKLLARLTHPGIARLIDAGMTSDGEPYLVLDYVDGKPIDQYCDAQLLSIDSRLRLFLDVLAPVAHAHANLIVHRDIKPSNVLVTASGQIKLLDFGIAKLLDFDGQAGADPHLTREAGVALTPAYASPEQVTGGPITVATDVYSLGILLFQLLTGRHPGGEAPMTAAELLKTVIDADAPRPSAVVSTGSEAAASSAANRSSTRERLHRQLRGDLDTIVGKALKKEPSQRYVSVTAFAEDVSRHLEHKPIDARPDTLAYRTAKFVRRNRVPVALTGFAFVAVLAGLAGTLIQARAAQQQRDFAFQQLRQNEEHDEFLDFLLADASPSGKPLSADELLARAEHIVDRQHAANVSRRADLMIWIGRDYSRRDRDVDAHRVLQAAYQSTRGLQDEALKGRASCEFANTLARDQDLDRAESLFQQGQRELAGDPRYAIERSACLRAGSEVARARGETAVGIERAREGLSVLMASPLRTDAAEMSAALDLASAYSEGGQDPAALVQFERAAKLQSELGLDESNFAVLLYNNWALELDQVGRPLEAEKIYRRVLSISRDSEAAGAVSPMVLNNYARILRELDRFNEAIPTAEQAYERAVQVRSELAISQSLMERCALYTVTGQLDRADAMLALVEPRLQKSLPAGHYAFAALASRRASIALARKDLKAAMQQSDRAVAMLEAAIKAGNEGAFLLPILLIDRSDINRGAGRFDNAAQDADRAMHLLLAAVSPGSYSSKVGLARLALARAFDSEHRVDEARAQARIAAEQLEKTLGIDHPDAQSARRLASKPRADTA